jgi:hypothetical protein
MMRQRMRAALVISRRQLLEAILSPGPWVSLVVGLALAHGTVTSFAGAIDSSGFNPELNPVTGVLARALGGAFGTTLVGKLFSEGPFILALLTAAVPVLGWLAISSVLRFGLEKNAGAVELLAYGPADGTAYCFASFLRDAVLATSSLLVILGFLGVEAVTGSMVLGPRFFTTLAAVWTAALALSGWGILCCVVTAGASSTLALFAGLALLFLVVLGGSFTISSAPVRAASVAAAWAVQWFSPFHYMVLALRARGVGLAGALLLQLVLTAALLAASHFVISRRGVRA